MEGQSGSSALMLIVLLAVALAAAAAFLVRARASGPEVPAPPMDEGQPISRPTSASLADDLSTLADLREKGILSPQEFEVEKANLLGSRS